MRVYRDTFSDYMYEGWFPISLLTFCMRVNQDCLVSSSSSTTASFLTLSITWKTTSIQIDHKFESVWSYGTQGWTMFPPLPPFSRCQSPVLQALSVQNRAQIVPHQFSHINHKQGRHFLILFVGIPMVRDSSLPFLLFTISLVSCFSWFPSTTHLSNSNLPTSPRTAALLLLLSVAHRIGDVRVRSPSVPCVRRHLGVACLPLLVERHCLLPTRQTVTCMIRICLRSRLE